MNLFHAGTPTSRRCRFYRWVAGLKVDDNDIVVDVKCPSLDVCLVWHAFMLNPRSARSTLLWGNLVYRLLQPLRRGYR